jgi:hypothetical protein
MASLTSESLHFKIELAGTYWKKRPIYSILVNEKLIETKEISAPSGETFYVEFDTELEEGPNKLHIRLDNKDWTDTVQSIDKTEILKDMLLNIKSVEIDTINIGDIVFTHSVFTGDDPDRPVLDKCVDLGWNGTWTLPFETPFYIWLLETL